MRREWRHWKPWRPYSATSVAPAAHPDWGCDRISRWLELGKVPLSATTVQKILKRHGLGRADLRLRKVN